jgi:hypothetical protein
MKFAPAVVFASALTLLSAGVAPADFDPPEASGLYSTVNVLNFFTPDLRAELKVTPEQQRGLETIDNLRGGIWRRYCQEKEEVRKLGLPDKEKWSRFRGLDTWCSAELFQLYGRVLTPTQINRMRQIVLQIRGMEIFDHVEIREALKIGDKEVRALKDAYNEFARDEMKALLAAVEAKTLDRKDAARRASLATFGVPERVRKVLNKEQQRVLDSILGEKYTYGYVLK